MLGAGGRSLENPLCGLQIRMSTVFCSGCPVTGGVL